MLSHSDSNATVHWKNILTKNLNTIYHSSYTFLFLEMTFSSTWSLPLKYHKCFPHIRVIFACCAVLPVKDSCLYSVSPMQLKVAAVGLPMLKNLHIACLKLQASLSICHKNPKAAGRMVHSGYMMFVFTPPSKCNPYTSQVLSTNKKNFKNSQ